MFWIEMSRDEVHGGGEWKYSKCVWSPTRKKNNQRWPFWEIIKEVKKNDFIIHLRGKGKNARFNGISIADSDGYETEERPPNPGEWDFSSKFNKIELKDYVEFENPIMLKQFFENNNSRLKDIYLKNKELSTSIKRKLFYVIQSGRLQCLNGAYFSEAPHELVNIIFNKTGSYELQEEQINYVEDTKVEYRIKTGQAKRLINQRLGQQSFSKNVKMNYNNCCCFPECEVNEEEFLIGSHIDRWADNEKVRGEISNGLCLCLLHDKAFENGYFFISDNYTILLNKRKVSNSLWARNIIELGEGKAIKLGKIKPGLISLEKHRERIKSKY